jgi:DNA-binding NarL/FixJ family response regulator
MKILLVDDHSILLDGIARLLEKSINDLVAKANTINEALNYFNEADFDILITNFNLIDDNGLNLIRKVKSIYPNLKIIVLSMHDEAHLVEEISKNGVNGYLLGKDSHHDLIEALEAMDKSEVYLNDDIYKILYKALNQQKKKALLTKREAEVLKLISKDFSPKQIGDILAISEKTIDKHYKSICKKTKTSSLEGLLKYAYANNLI